MHSATHGSHVCHKCGWTFPNPHPSAKHRRAHKKVCGKIEGFRVHESEENAHLSFSEDEEDHDKVGEETMSDVKGSGLIGRQVSNRSEEEEFSDAVAEFVDTGTSSAVAQTTVVHDLAERDLKSSSIANIKKSPENHHNSQMKSSQVLDNIGAQLEYDMQSETSSSSTVTVLASDMPDKSLALEVTKEADTSSNSASTIETNLPENSLTENIQTSETLNALVQIEEDTGTRGKSEVDGSSSIDEASFSKTESKSSEQNLNSLKVEGFTEEVPLDVTEVSDVRSVTLPVDGIMDVEGVDASGQNMYQHEVPLCSCSGPIEAEAIEHVDASVDGAQVDVDFAHQSDIQCPNDNTDICNEEKVNEKYLPPSPKPIEMPVEDLPGLDVQDCQGHEPSKLEPSLTSDCGEAIVQMLVQNLAYEKGHPDCLSNKSDEIVSISSPAVQALEDKLPQEGASNKIIVEQPYSEGEHVTSGSKDTIKECLESNGSEALPDPMSNDIKSGHTGTNEMVCSLEEQESHLSQEDLFCKIQPQTIPAVSATCDVMVSPEDAVNNEANNVVIHRGNAVHEEDKYENSDVAEKCFVEATVVEDLSTDRKFGPEDNSFCEFKSNREEIVTTPLDAFTHSIGTASNANQGEGMLESSYNKQDCHGEHFLDSSKAPVLRASIDSSVSETVRVDTLVAVDGVEELIHVGRKFKIDTEDAKVQSGKEDPALKESIALAKYSGPENLSSSAVEVGAECLVEGVTSDVLSPSLMEESNYAPLKQQPEASPTVPPEGSVDSISQTDSVDGHWGSVSDGNIPSSRYAADAPSIFEDEVQPETNIQTPKHEAQEEIKGAREDPFSGGTDIAEAPPVILEGPGGEDGQRFSFSEIQAVENQQQTELPSIPANASPSLSDVVHKSKGKKKSEEEIIAKVVNWNADKSRTPLRSLLVEANLESKQKTASVQGHMDPPTKKDDVTSMTDEGLSAKQVPPMTAELSIFDATERNSEKEWNSPARLPNSREKRKVRYWVPFVCCSSVN